MFTTSGSYSIALTFGGEIIADKRVHILKVEPDTTYPLASYLEQKSPKVFVEMVDGQVYQSTTNLEDGAFLGSVGRNSYTLVLQDRYGNRLNSMNFAAAFNGKNTIPSSCVPVLSKIPTTVNTLSTPFINILSPINGTKKIEVYSLTGRKLMENMINGDILNVSSLNTGFYMMKVSIEDQSKIFKLIIR